MLQRTRHNLSRLIAVRHLPRHSDGIRVAAHTPTITSVRAFVVKAANRRAEKAVNDSESIESLQELKSKSSEEYYTEGTSTLTDEQYDVLVQKIQKLTGTDTASLDVGTTATAGGATALHASRMLSLNSTTTTDELRAFAKSMTKRLVGARVRYTLEMKYDGMAVSLLFRNGQLIAAITRGDGVKGEIITNSVRALVNNIPAPALVISQFGTAPFEVRGEIVMSKAEYERFKAKQIEDTVVTAPVNGNVLSTARNLTVGLLRRDRKNDEIDELLPRLQVITYSLHITDAANNDPNAVNVVATQTERLTRLKRAGFTTCSLAAAFDDIDGAINFVDGFMARRAAFEYECDGVVIKVDDIAQQELLGATSHHPRWAIAWKPPAQGVTTTVRDIIWEAGRSSRITPVAVLNDVICGGVTVRKASLHNAAHVQTLQIRVGDVVRVERKGDVIPHITGIIRTDDDIQTVTNTRPVFALPTHCPCEIASPITRRGVDLMCDNPHCPSGTTAKLAHYASRGAMNIDGLGASTIQFLNSLQPPLLTTLISIPKLIMEPALSKLRAVAEDTSSTHRFRGKRVSNLISAIRSAHENASDESVLIALGIPRLGQSGAAALLQRFQNLTALRQATADDMKGIKGIGIEIANSIVQNLQNHKELLDFIQSMQKKPISIS